MRVELRRVFINESRDKESIWRVFIKESIYQGEHLSRRVFINESRNKEANYQLFFW